MRRILSVAIAASALCPVVTSAPALAQDHGYYGRSGDGYRQGGDRYRDDRVYRGREGRYRRRCDGGNGAVGTIAGGAGGALIGNALGGGTLGTVAGGVGGALLGRHLDKRHTRHEEGC
jgi:hypothetical protein